LGEAGGINLYGFVGNNPINWLDLLGLVSLNWVPTNQSQCPWFNNITPPDVYSIASHGDPDQIYDQSRTSWTPEELADCLLNDPESRYNPGMPIVLYACSTGQGENSFAQKLADILASAGAPTTVFAPTKDLWVGPLGGMNVPGGAMVPFLPSGSRGGY